MTRASLLLIALTAPLLAARAQDSAPESAAPTTDSGPTDEAAPGWLHGPDEDPLPPNWGLGLFEVTDPFLLNLNRLALWTGSPEILPHAGLALALRSSWSNTYAFANGRYVIDGEVRTVTASLRVGLFDRIELGINLPYQWRGGGIMDDFIDGFHDAFSLPGADRSRVPEDRYRVSGLVVGDGPFSYDHAGYGFSDLTLEGRVQLTQGGAYAPAVTAGLLLRLPTGRRKFDLSDGVDVSFTLDLSKRLGARSPFVLYAGGAVTYYAHAHLNGLTQYRVRGQLHLGLEWELTDWISLVAHGWIESRRQHKLFRDLNDRNPGSPFFDSDLAFGHYVSLIAGGFKFEPREGWIFEVGVLENLIDPETTADFGVLFNAAVRW